LARDKQRANPKIKQNMLRILVMAAVAMQANRDSNQENIITFDTDSGPIRVDNQCTGCILDNIDDFDGPLTDSGWAIKGFGETRRTNVKIGMIVWKWTDDQGKEYKFKIPKLFYVPDGGIRLLMPQHWAKEQNDKKPTQGTGSETLDNKVTLFWNQRKHKLTIPLGKADNVATFQLASGYKQFSAFCAEADLDYQDEQESAIIAK
jgi:hypothetical protein